MFPQFSVLPGELRIKIWEYTSSTRRPRIVAFVPGPPDQTPRVGARLLVQSVDLATISRSCKEARCVFEKTHHRMILPGSSELLVPRAILLACSETVFYLGNGAGIEAILNLLGSRPQCDHIQHIAVGWSTFRDLITLCKRLPVFRQLQTFTILMPGGQGVLSLTNNEGEISSLATSIYSHDEEVKEFDTDYLGAIVKAFLSPEFQRAPRVTFAVSEFM